MTALTPQERLLELAARCERATGPDRELDLDIARLLGVTVMRRNSDVMRRNSDDTANVEHTYWQYTESLDAAMSLVPDGTKSVCVMKKLYFNGRADSDILYGEKLRHVKCDDAANPALALCAAALRARARAGVSA